MTDVVLAVDIGGTKTAAALIDAGSGVVATATAPTPDRRDPPPSSRPSEASLRG